MLPKLKNFCCCCCKTDTISGSIVIGSILLFFSVVGAAGAGYNALAELDNVSEKVDCGDLECIIKKYMSAVYGTTLTFFLLNAIVESLLIVGCVKKMANLVLPFIVWTSLFTSISIIMFIVTPFLLGAEYIGLLDTDPRAKIVLITNFLFCGLYVWMIIVVVSARSEILEFDVMGREIEMDEQRRVLKI